MLRDNRCAAYRNAKPILRCTKKGGGTSSKPYE
jgi:hypothetical protein